ncbi:IPO4 isoform 6 [Pongo abelii]|uniref:IPO4 isoform 6 n=1 Tax=Pongo abelii TaxID=9601 RepID=A0A2J8TRE2_PONAB|nr:IPO4 isoform 6 [Pongo abelii]
MEPAGLEQLLRELLLPDTERIRRLPPRPRNSFRSFFGPPPLCRLSATC